MRNERAKPYKTIVLTLGLLLLAVAPRVWALDVFVTPDEHRWVRRSIQFTEHLVTGQPQMTPADRFPGVTTRWTGLAGLFLSHAAQSPDVDLLDYLAGLDPTDMDILPLMRLPTALITAGCVAIILLLARRLFGGWPALLAGVLLALDPFLIGLSRVIHHDALVSSFVGVAVLGLLAYLREDRSRVWLLLLAGVASALALLSKATAGFLLPYAAFIAAISCLRWDGASPRLDRARSRRAILGLVGWALITLVVVLAWWPAMWVAPLDTLQLVLSQSTHFAETPHELGNYFLGQPIEDPGALFYPVAILFRATPLVLVGLVAAPLWLWRRQRRPGAGLTLFALGAFVLLFIAFVTLGAKKFDRYALPAILLIDVLAGVGLAGLLDWLRRGLSRRDRRLPRLVGATGVALVLVLQGALLWPHVPYYLSYYNPLLGGPQGAVQALMVGWGEGCDRAADYLNRQDHAADLTVTTWYADNCLGPLFAGTAWDVRMNLSISEPRNNGLPWYAADYVVLYVNQIQREIPSRAFLDFFQSQEPTYVARIAGLDYAWVYRMPERIPASLLPAAHTPVHQIPAGDFGPIRLVHYALGDAAFQRQTASFAAGETAYLALQSRTERPLPARYKVFAHMVDSQGRLLTQADALLGGWEEEQDLLARPSRRIMNYLALPIPPATPPGDYTIAVGFYEADTDRRLSLLNDLGQPTGTTVPLGTLRVTRPAAPPASADLPIQHPHQVVLPVGLTLLGYDLAPAAGWAGEPLSVALYWQAQRDHLPDLTVALALRDAAGQVWAEQASRPADGAYPTPGWVAGEIVRDVHDLVVAAAAPPGDLQLVLRVGDSETALTTVPIVGRQHIFDVPAVSHPLPTDLTAVRFLGYDLPTTRVRPGEPLALTLYWQCLSPMDTSYKVFVHLVDDVPQVWGQVDRLPCDGECPTTSWLPGEVLAGAYQLTPRPETPPGAYRIVVGLYDEQTGTRMIRADGTGDHILLDTTITVP